MVAKIRSVPRELSTISCRGDRTWSVDLPGDRVRARCASTANSDRGGAHSACSYPDDGGHDRWSDSHAECQCRSTTDERPDSSADRRCDALQPTGGTAFFELELNSRDTDLDERADSRVGSHASWPGDHAASQSAGRDAYGDADVGTRRLTHRGEPGPDRADAVPDASVPRDSNSRRWIPPAGCDPVWRFTGPTIASAKSGVPFPVLWLMRGRRGRAA